jgi:hypothetical protein
MGTTRGTRRKPVERKVVINDPLVPSVGLLCKLGSVAVHAEEYLFSGNGHEFDKTALQQLLADPEVRDWLKEMDARAYLPKQR